MLLLGKRECPLAGANGTTAILYYFLQAAAVASFWKDGGRRRDEARTPARPADEAAGLAWPGEEEERSFESVTITAMLTQCLLRPPGTRLVLQSHFAWQQSYAVGTIITPILQRRKMGHGEVKKLAQGS